ncbi:SAYSvFN domain-containing protein [Plasmodiophora brassicae]|nr:hypothetical protein PBRA_008037 [Plasmodiophora brassicae]
MAGCVSVRCAVALTIWIASAYAGFFELGTIALIAFVILSNLGTKAPGETASGYAVFNEGGRPLPGTISVEDFDDMRHNRPSTRYQSISALAADIETNADPVLVQRRSKQANQPCPCNSGLKYKKCHGRALSRDDQERLKEWEDEWT